MISDDDEFEDNSRFDRIDDETSDNSGGFFDNFDLFGGNDRPTDDNYDNQTSDQNNLLESASDFLSNLFGSFGDLFGSNDKNRND
jgi:hypothetical protein